MTQSLIVSLKKKWFYGNETAVPTSHGFTYDAVFTDKATVAIYSSQNGSWKLEEAELQPDPSTCHTDLTTPSFYSHCCDQ